MVDVLEHLRAHVAPSGSQLCAVSAHRVVRLKEDMEALHPQVDPQLHAAYLQGAFDFALPQRVPEIRSIVVVATPSPRARLVFHHEGAAVPVEIGPIYTDRGGILDQVKRAAVQVLCPEGYHTWPVRLPKKMLAIRGGLGDYGRNNLLYVPGLGSFHRLTAFASDIPVEDVWREPVLAPRCDRCTACLRACPTGAIPQDRVMIHAERCVTFVNERPGEVPAWMGPDAMRCLVGCMACQQGCPLNRDARRQVTDLGTFGEDETALLLAAKHADDLPGDLLDRLRDINLDPYVGVLGRNLDLILRSASWDV